jgi:hypothetical protein
MTARQTAQAFFDALQRRAFAEAAALVEPAHAARHHHEQIAHLLAWVHFQKLLKGPGPHPSGFHSKGDFDPEDLKRHAGTPIPGYRDASTLGAIAALSPHDFLTRRFEAAGQLQEHHKRTDGTLAPITTRILGEVPYSRHVAFVVYVRERQPREDGPAPVPDWPHAETLPLFYQADRWYVGLNVWLKLAGPGLPLGAG